MARLVSRFLTDRRGSSAIEYALIAGILGVGLIISLTSLKDALALVFSTVMDRAWS